MHTVSNRYCFHLPGLEFV